MDLSRFKWPLIIAIVAGAIWLITDPGVKFMVKRFTADEPGVDPKRDELNEAGLTRVALFLMQTFRYASAEVVINEALTRFPNGKNALVNEYRLAKCVEKQGRYDECIAILQRLRDMDANASDERIPPVDALNLRIDKLAETHELGEVGQL
jgi:tetratricopeptide (TPR) repeat protein